MSKKHIAYLYLLLVFVFCTGFDSLFKRIYSAPPMVKASRVVPPTATQTPVQTVSTFQGMAGFGDSFTVGYLADLGVNDFVTLTTNRLNEWHPDVFQFNDGTSGSTAHDYVVAGEVANKVNGFLKSNYFNVWFTLWWGQNECQTANSGAQPGNFYLATEAQAVTYSGNWKSDMQTLINQITAVYPITDPMLPTPLVYKGQIVLCTLPDVSTAGGGAWTNFDPGNWPDYTKCVTQYNTRVQELCVANNCYLADIHAALYGCSSCFSLAVGFPHPTVQGHQIIANTILSVLSSPPRN